ncbi:hypothetical protein AAHA92_25083 [Salvia divinorum]|uniref:Glycine-rich protein n=1 Tax=Salvia divinorum TaxID=28513 RepID=A0ABD1G9H4_SALDI
MEETYSEGGVGPSHSKPEEELLSKMAQIMADLKNDVNGIRSDVRESEIRIQTIHNTLFEEVHTLKKSQSSRPPTPRKYHIPNVILKEYNGEEGYDGGYARNRGGNWEDECLGMGNGVHGRFGNGNGRNGDWRYGDYKSYERYSRGMHGGGEYESRYHGGELDRRSRRERVTRIQEESHLRRNEEYERLKGYEKPIERDALCRVRRGSSSRHGDCDNTQSCIIPWKTDTSNPIASPKSSFDSLMEQFQRVISSRNGKYHDSKCKGFGYEAKEECKSKGYDPLRKEREREKA